MNHAPTDVPAALAAKLEQIESEHDRLAAMLEDPEVLADHRRVRDVSIRKAAIAPVAQGYGRYKSLIAEAAELRDAIAPGGDAELAQFAQEELPRVEHAAAAELEHVKEHLVTSDDRAVGSVIMEVRAGTGGDEAGLWARDLLGVYEKYAVRKGWTFETMEMSADPSVGGVRSAVVNIRGEGVWSELAFEAGVHSVKRVPETETQGRIHTSTATVAVLPEPEDVEVEIDWARDVIEDVTTSQGPGGQNVNKVATAVKLVHIPTGIEVRMQESKSQHQNRDKARRLLRARVLELEMRKAQAERSAQRKGQIGTGERSEKVRVYRYQDGIVADQRVDEKFQLREVLAGDLGPLMNALLEQEVARRLAEL